MCRIHTFRWKLWDECLQYMVLARDFFLICYFSCNYRLTPWGTPFTTGEAASWPPNQDLEEFSCRMLLHMEGTLNAVCGVSYLNLSTLTMADICQVHVQSGLLWSSQVNWYLSCGNQLYEWWEAKFSLQIFWCAGFSWKLWDNVSSIWF